MEWVYDSKWTADVATGLCKPKCHLAAVALAQHLLCLLVSRFDFYGRWVKGHSLDYWNDKVDALAKDGALRRLRTHRGAIRSVPILDVLSRLVDPFPCTILPSPISPRTSTCPRGHALRRWQPKRLGYACNTCGRESVAGDTIFSCRFRLRFRSVR